MKQNKIIYWLSEFLLFIYSDKEAKAMLESVSWQKSKERKIFYWKICPSNKNTFFARFKRTSIIGTIGAVLCSVVSFLLRQNAGDLRIYNFLGLVLFVFAMLSLIFPYLLSTADYLKIYVDKDNKKVYIKYNSNNKTKTVFDFFSSNYLPEFRLPENEWEKYEVIRQNLQQAISLETGLKFDTQEFLKQEKLDKCF